MKPDVDRLLEVAAAHLLMKTAPAISGPTEHMKRMLAITMNHTTIGMS